MRSPNYDPAFKIEACEEYFSRLYNGENITKTDFAKEKNVRYSTFLACMEIYRKYQLNKENGGAILTTIERFGYSCSKVLFKNYFWRRNHHENLPGTSDYW